jgi:lysine decarboxylase/arginine decarboxylase
MNDVLQWSFLFVYDHSDKLTLYPDKFNETLQILQQRHQHHIFSTDNYAQAYKYILEEQCITCIILRTEKEQNRSVLRTFIRRVRGVNAQIPILIFPSENERVIVANMLERELFFIPDNITKSPNELAAFIAAKAEPYEKSILPPFFRALEQYVDSQKYAWHTPGHMGGKGFLNSPAGNAFFRFFGENLFRSDLSISVTQLGSLLDHSGVIGESERLSAKTFGADKTFYVLNGTSNANQMIWTARVFDNDLALIDRNCHKSLNYAVVISRGLPIYMQPRRNGLGIIGPVALSEFTSKRIKQNLEQSNIFKYKTLSPKVKMSALTNSTYDGICYNVNTIKNQLDGEIENLHFDEAWFAYARFHPLYKGFYGMTPNESESTDYPPIFTSQSTHKMLTALSQSSMLHIKNGSKENVDFQLFNESFMMHSTTSPQYVMIASLDVATKMMSDNGTFLIQQTLKDAVMLRKKISRMCAWSKMNNDWFFGIWQPETIHYQNNNVPFYLVREEYLVQNQSCWILKDGDNWHGFSNIEENYVMLDPLKITFTCPGLNIDGSFDEEGIPAVIVTRFLQKRGIVVEKSDYYSWLMLNMIGSSENKHEALISALKEFKQAYDNNLTLAEVFPTEDDPYALLFKNVRLKDHCNEMHQAIRNLGLVEKMQMAYNQLPKQILSPSEAHKHVAKGSVKKVRINELKNKVLALTLVPYPPGIPMAMGGEMIEGENNSIVEYLLALELFERQYPGYESDIHGIERITENDETIFTTYIIE